MADEGKVRIFIADDHPLLRTGLRLAFREFGDIEVVGEAANGFDAIEKVKETVPDVSLIDIDMPGLSGTAAIRVLRKIFPAMKILVLSTYNDVNYIKSAMEAGANGYILKAASIDDLVEIIHAFHEGKETFSPYLLNLGVDLEAKQKTAAASEVAITRRETQILQYISDGKDNKDIAGELFLSVETVKTHVKSIFRKLEAKNRLEAVRKGRGCNIIN